MIALPKVKVGLLFITCGFFLQTCLITAELTSKTSEINNIHFDGATLTERTPPYFPIRRRTSAAVLPYCPVGNGTELKWTRKMGDTQFAYLNRWKQLWCCANGYIKIKWIRRSVESSQWREVMLDSGTMLGFNQQQLVIKKFKRKDEGVYRCIAEDSSGKQTISHQYVVVMDENQPKCDPNGTPIFGKPRQNNTAYPGEIGEDRTITCLASFGMSCGFGDILTVVKWVEVVNNTCWEHVGYQSGPKDTGSTVNRTLKSRDLLIKNITESDFERQWCCMVSRNKRNYAVRVVRLLQVAAIKPTTVIKDETSLKLILSILLSAVGAAVITLTILWCYRLEILLLLHARFGERPDQGDFEFRNDLILVHSGSQKDYRFVGHVLAAELENRNHPYAVFLPNRDLDIGYLDGAWINGLRASRKIVVILSEGFLTEQVCGTIHNYIVNENRSKDVIYIQYLDIPKRLWESKDIIPNIDLLQRAVKIAGRNCLGLGKLLKWREDYGHFDEEDNNIFVNNGEQGRAIDKFWKQFCLYLPPRHEVVRNAMI